MRKRNYLALTLAITILAPAAQALSDEVSMERTPAATESGTSSTTKHKKKKKKSKKGRSKKHMAKAHHGGKPRKSHASTTPGASAPSHYPTQPGGSGFSDIPNEKKDDLPPPAEPPKE